LGSRTPNQRGSPWAAYGAAIWAAIFAVFHIVWAAGWYPLLNAERMRVAFAVPWKWTFDVVVAGMCVIAVPVALAPVTPLGRHVPGPLVFALAVTGSGLLVLRATASLVQVSYHISIGRFEGLGIWEPYFYLGAVLFAVSTWQSRRDHDRRIGAVRVDPADFRRLDLRCHTLLGDVPLHDVWAIPLDGGGPGRSLQDVRALLHGDRQPPTNVWVRALFALRWWLGGIFRWDDERHDPPGASYVHRLTEADRRQSRVLPGTREGPFRVLYLFDDEAVSEIRNATVHGFLASALTRRGQDYMLYRGIYVKAVSRFTSLYMAVIDPFRRFVVYPGLARQIQQAWLRASDSRTRSAH
jgi:Protein of unknown function (DUF2867)